MDEEEIVLSNWKRSENNVEGIKNGSEQQLEQLLERDSTRESLARENAELKARRLEKDGRKTEFSKEFGIHESVDEVTLDDDTLSRLIEGDVRKQSHFGSSEKTSQNPTSPRPKPRPRHKENLPEHHTEEDTIINMLSGRKEKFRRDSNPFADNNENRTDSKSKDSAAKLFSGDKNGSPSQGRKNSAGSIFSGNREKSPNRERKNSADKLFSGSKDRSPERERKGSAASLFVGKKDKPPEEHQQKTSPRPVPRPRSGRATKEKPEENEKRNRRKVSSSDDENVGKLFDSSGKAERTKDRKGKKENGSDIGYQFNTKNELTRESGRKGINKDKVPPTRPIRTNVKQKEGSEPAEKSPRQPKPSKPRDKRLDTGDSSVRQGSHGNSTERQSRINGVGQDPQGYHRQSSVREDASFRVHDKQQDYARETDGFIEKKDGRREEEDHWRDVNGHNEKGRMEKDGYGRDIHHHRRKGDDMFEEHVPKLEGVLHHDGDDDHERTKEGRIRRNAPMKAERRLEEMAKSPDLYSFQYESRDVPYHPSPHHGGGQGDFAGAEVRRQRSSSLDNSLDASRRGVRFEREQGETVGGGWGSPRSGEDLPSSRNIRESVYNDWLQKKQPGLKEKAKKKLEDKKREEEKEKELLEKKETGKKAFEVWNSKKEEVLKEKAKKKKELINKEIDEKRETIGKQKDAKKFFESWKARKDEVLKESFSEKKAKEKEAKQKEVEDIKEKTVMAKKSFDKWKERKDEEIKQAIKNKRKEELNKTQQEIETERDKRHENEKAYQEFLQKKGTAKRRPPSPSLTQRAWSPAGLTKGTNLIPQAIQPVVPTAKLNRSRSFSGTTTMTSSPRPGSARKGW